MVDAAYPPIVQSALSKMDEQQKLTFESEYARRRKKTGTMAISTIFFVHFFFYGRVGMGIFFLVCCVTVIGFVWWPVELCMVGKRVREHNGELAVNLARDLKLMA